MLAPGLTQVITFTDMTKAQTKATSGSKKLLIYDYEDAWWRLIEQIFDAFHMLDPMLRLLPPVRSPHAGPFRYTQGDRTLDQRPGLVTFKGSADADLREGDIEGHTAFIYDFAQARVQNMAAQTFAMVPEVTDFFDQAVDAGGRPFIDNFLQAIEKIWLRFVGDEELVVTFTTHPQATPGKCLYVSLPGQLIGFVHPDTLEKVTKASFTEEQQRGYDEIVARKRAEQHAAKRTRRLS
jgi:hypothetical protein